MMGISRSCIFCSVHTDLESPLTVIVCDSFSSAFLHDTMFPESMHIRICIQNASIELK